jgi:hypothetical protein
MKNGKTDLKQTRQKRRKEKLGLDLLTLCYTYDKVLFDTIYNSENSKITFDDFYLYRIESDEDTQVVNIVIQMPDDTDQLLGTLTFLNGRRYSDKAFLKVNNKALYTRLLQLLPYVEDTLQLKFNNITKVDIALTSTYNYTKAILKSIRNYKRLEMIYNGRRVANPESKIQDFIEIYPRNRKKRINNPTLVFGHKKDTGIRCKVYDKGKELIEESAYKIDYINKWLDFHYKNLYRIEVSLSNTEVRSFCAAAAKIREDWRHGAGIIDNLQSPEFQSFLFHKALSSVLYFKRDGKRVEVWDL